MVYQILTDYHAHRHQVLVDGLEPNPAVNPKLGGAEFHLVGGCAVKHAFGDINPGNRLIGRGVDTGGLSRYGVILLIKDLGDRNKGAKAGFFIGQGSPHFSLI